MKVIYKILQKTKRSIWTLFAIPVEIKNFGLVFAFKHAFYQMILQWTESEGIYAQKHQLILSYLESDFSDIVHEIREAKLTYVNQQSKKIWVFWYQGLDKAPKIVRKCRELLTHTYSNNYEIVELDGVNYREYCKLPDFVEQKVKDGKISLTEFSDILRTKLLYENGGMWVDSTLLVQNKIDEKLLDLPFYTIRNQGIAPYCVSGLRLSTFYQYYKPNNNYVGFLSRLLLACWERHDVLMEYLLMDYFMILIANNNTEFEIMLDKVPFTNPNVHTLRNRINEEYSEEGWNNLVSDTHFFKMTYKMLMTEFNSFGNKTFYGHIINDL